MATNSSSVCGGCLGRGRHLLKSNLVPEQRRCRSPRQAAEVGALILTLTERRIEYVFQIDRSVLIVIQRRNQVFARLRTTRCQDQFR